jgi:tetraacyldisaccharide 4'-kinase
MNESEFLRIISGERTDITAALSRVLLHGLSWGYGTGVRLRNLAWEMGLASVHQPAVPVISIGNLTTGGTGKTPVTALLCRMLQTMQHRPGILSRGYRAQSEQGNDEFRVLQLTAPGVPHVQNPDRIAGLQRLLQSPDPERPDVVLLDDGMQHRRLGRALNLVLVDASNPFGFGRLLPRGLLREPLNGFRRADAVILTRCELASASQLDQLGDTITQHAPQLRDHLLHLEFHPTGLRDCAGVTSRLSTLQQTPVWLLSGIGNPEAFRRTCEQAGATITGTSWFPDHHHFTPAELQLVRQRQEQSGAAFVLTTLKDLVRIPPQPAFQALEIEAVLPLEQLETLQLMLQDAISPFSS